MIFTSLSDRDVAALIQAIKEFLQNPDFAIPILGQYKNEENVEDRLNGAQYILYSYRGRRASKYSIHLRSSEAHLYLIRLCINGSRHHNLDGTVVGVNDLHVYKHHEDTGDIESYTYSLDATPFSDIQGLSEALDKFMEYTINH
ncbi:DUF6978 family protein [Schleiferilactobacillus harbinensis]|uniref:DUF6978 family protein n=1 Tax=Schleiferilactobacillus harbinensis TaxID=304207 RepID=UPI00345E5FA0